MRTETHAENVAVTVDDRRQPPTVRRVAKGLSALRNLATHPGLRPWLLAVAALLFAVLAVASFRSLPDEGRDAQPALIAVLVLLTGPATVVLNALEYRFMAARLGIHLRLRSAVHTSLLASMANFLPVPGGVAVRTAALRSKGTSVGSALSINLVAGLVWAGLTGLAAGMALLATGQLPGRAAAAVVVGSLLLTASMLIFKRSGAAALKELRPLFAIEAATVVVSGVRLWLALAAIGQAASLGAALAISTSAVLAALIGVFPAGLGLREALAGGLAAAVGVAPAAAIAATAVDRLAGQVGLGLTAVLSGVRLSELRSQSTSERRERPDTSTAGQ